MVINISQYFKLLGHMLVISSLLVMSGVILIRFIDDIVKFIVYCLKDLIGGRSDML